MIPSSSQNLQRLLISSNRMKTILLVINGWNLMESLLVYSREVWLTGVKTMDEDLKLCIVASKKKSKADKRISNANVHSALYRNISSRQYLKGCT